MASGFFKKIADLFNGDNSNGSIKNDDDNPRNGIDRQGELLRAVIQILGQNYRGANVDLTNFHLILLVNNGLLYPIVNTPEFQEQVITEIHSQLGLAFASIRVAMGNPTKNDAVEIMDGCYLQLEENKTENVVPNRLITKAIISQVDGYGSLIGGSVEIDSESIKTLPSRKYNIGIGKEPMIDSRIRRVNHIAIDDNEYAEQFERNKYVSRTHAHISFSEQHGFVLYVENGRTTNGHSTAVLRGGKTYEVDNVIVPQQLQDGDYIMLSNRVQLLFKVK